MSQKHTAGAIRAARAVIIDIWYNGKGESTESDGALCPDNAKWIESQIPFIATIIDRETGLPEALEALRGIANNSLLNPRDLPALGLLFRINKLATTAIAKLDPPEKKEVPIMTQQNSETRHTPKAITKTDAETALANICCREAAPDMLKALGEIRKELNKPEPDILLMLEIAVTAIQKAEDTTRIARLSPTTEDEHTDFLQKREVEDPQEGEEIV